MEKRCCICKNDLPIGNFGKDKSRGDGYEAKCKVCKKEISDIYRKTSKDKIAAYEESRKEAKRQYNRIYQKQNKDRINQQKKDQRRINPIKFRERYKNRFHTDSQFRLAQNIRTRIRKALERNSKSGKSLDLLGCTILELKVYLENRFLPTMTWENYGALWHIDHIKPCSSFDLTNEGEQRKCFHYTNLQPLFAVTTIIDGVEYIGNLEKSDKLVF